MGDQQSFSRLIVTYRDGAAAKNNRSAIARNMATALSRAGLSTQDRPANVSYMSKLAIDSDLEKTSRNLHRAESADFLPQLAVRTGDAHVAGGRLSRPERARRTQSPATP